MARLSPLLLALISLLCFPSTAPAQPEANRPSTGLLGTIERDHYIAPGGLYRVKIPVLPELGGSISDTGNVVVFRDDYSTHVSIGAFVLDATQRWELATTEREQYLTAFFAMLVMPDFEKMFPGSQIETTRFEPGLLSAAEGVGAAEKSGSETRRNAGTTKGAVPDDEAGGAVFCFTLLPGGSMFGTPFADARAAREGRPPVAKRGNLIFAQNGVVYVLSIELSERLHSRNYQKTPEEENALLSQRLTALLHSMQFAGATGTSPRAHATK
ncbi:hypothetical protein AXK11_03195 [Cephaloticoccus primus]|uniref:Uncharacterized protein n=1 Tax=Cephaloticoccus primus TaxID=1548207 RepID=A0A139SQG2_9BACT|nr:hypothetical protein [Cephaloticoccus primus]KXU36816.1 hypothetical protein AXK11_03195 [Cephaloticoccus primus]